MINPKVKKIGMMFLRVGISVILLWFLFSRVDEKSMFAIVKNANKPLLLTALVTYFFCYALCVYRWSMLLKAVDIHIPIRRIIISFSGGTFFSLFLPSTIGGDFMRSVDLASHTQKTKEVLATVFLDRLSGYVGLVVLTLASLVYGWRYVNDSSTLVTIAIITLLLIFVLLIIFDKATFKKINRFLKSPDAGKLRELVTNLHHEIHLFRHKKSILVKNICISLLVQMVTPVTFYFLALAIGININMVYFFVFLPIIGAITLLPISIGGLGLRDATVVYFFAKAGVAKNPAFAMSLLNFSFIVFYGAIGGLIYVFTIHHRRLQYNPPSSLQPHRQQKNNR